MSKFYALVIGNDHSMKRVWMNEFNIKNLLEKGQVMHIYRASTDQYAKLTSNGEVVWCAVPNEDYKENV